MNMIPPSGVTGPSTGVNASVPKTERVASKYSEPLNPTTPSKKARRAHTNDAPVIRSPTNARNSNAKPW